jgi:sulfatase maturation enzyme AslB (radical SAM superfamily)
MYRKQDNFKEKLNSNLPSAAAKFLNRFSYGFKTLILRIKSPYLLGLVITDRCNLNCFYCESKNAGKIHFAIDQARHALSDAYKRGHRSLYFTGGEPMLWKDGEHGLHELVNYARELGFFEVFIFTNGTFPLDIERCNYIVTIDGPREIHNGIRNGSYDLIIKNVRNSVTKAVFASITFSKANVQYLEQFVDEISELDLFRGISFNLLTHWPEIIEKYGLSYTERIELLDKIWQLKKDGHPIVLSKAAYTALRKNNWKRPIPQIELGTPDRTFTCCRDIDNPSICANCGYANCVEVSQILALKPSAMWQVFKMVD